jgi:hypothetical protein
VIALLATSGQWFKSKTAPWNSQLSKGPCNWWDEGKALFPLAGRVTDRCLCPLPGSVGASSMSNATSELRCCQDDCRPYFVPPSAPSPGKTQHDGAHSPVPESLCCEWPGKMPIAPGRPHHPPRTHPCVTSRRRFRYPIPRLRSIVEPLSCFWGVSVFALDRLRRDAQCSHRSQNPADQQDSPKDSWQRDRVPRPRSRATQQSLSSAFREVASVARSRVGSSPSPRRKDRS